MPLTQTFVFADINLFTECKNAVVFSWKQQTKCNFRVRGLEVTCHTQGREECFIRYPDTLKMVKKTLFFNQLFSVWISDETLFRVFDIASQSINDSSKIQSNFKAKIPSRLWFPSFSFHELLMNFRSKEKTWKSFGRVHVVPQVQNRSFHVVERTKTSAKCQK